MNPSASGSAAPAGVRRLAIVVSHPTQYYSPWFAWLAAHAAIDLRVFYLWDFGVRERRDPQFGTSFAWDRDLLAGHAHEFVPNRAARPGSDRFNGLDNPALGARLRAWRPDAVLIFGYNYRTHLQLILRPPAPLIFRGDSHLLGRPKPGGWKGWLLKRLYARFAAFAYVGQANRDYFLAYGVPPAKLFFCPHCVDASHFAATAEAKAEAAALRERLGLAGRRVVLFAGKFVPAKQPLELLAAFQALAPAGAALVFVGGGEEQAALAAAAATRPDVMVRILPFANQSEMPARYLMADIFVLPSHGSYETWGLAINEAMHLGVPCLVSDRVGCQRDLVTDGVTGWVFRAGDAGHLREKLAQALAADLAAFQPRVAERIGHYDFAAAGLGLAAALQSIPRSPP
jgi:glycosyltransferase involved in cell wall biosynthesis